MKGAPEQSELNIVSSSVLQNAHPKCLKIGMEFGLGVWFVV